eukprot:12248560-Alexandrium_andersonii.AAC.1
MLWNRCPTARRLQQAHPCVLCRGQHTLDSIEHYVFCNRTRTSAGAVFRHSKLVHATSLQNEK